MSAIKLDNDFSLSLQDIKELNNEISKFQSNIESLGKDNVLFFDTADVREITGWSKKTVEDLFNHPAFPATDIGKRKLVLKVAFIKFFMDRRCRDNEDYWKYIA
ncbi:MAG: hypothetical protein ACLUFN_11405 [Eubacterium sp.]